MAYCCPCPKCPHCSPPPPKKELIIEEEVPEEEEITDHSQLCQNVGQPNVKLSGEVRLVVPWYKTICRRDLCQRPECIGPFDCKTMSSNVSQCDIGCDFPSKIPKKKKKRPMKLSSNLKGKLKKERVPKAQKVERKSYDYE